MKLPASLLLCLLLSTGAQAATDSPLPVSDWSGPDGVKIHIGANTMTWTLGNVVTSGNYELNSKEGNEIPFIFHVGRITSAGRSVDRIKVGNLELMTYTLVHAKLIPEGSNAMELKAFDDATDALVFDSKMTRAATVATSEHFKDQDLSFAVPESWQRTADEQPTWKVPIPLAAGVSFEIVKLELRTSAPGMTVDGLARSYKGVMAKDGFALAFDRAVQSGGRTGRHIQFHQELQGRKLREGHYSMDATHYNDVYLFPSRGHVVALTFSSGQSGRWDHSQLGTIPSQFLKTIHWH
jgi:hypothetical protein